jgi:hypothetical protein
MCGGRFNTVRASSNSAVAVRVSTAARVTAGGSMPWDDAAADVGDAHFKFFDLMRQVGAAAVQVGKNGTARQVTEASKVLSDTRRRLYQILAEDDLDGEATA